MEAGKYLILGICLILIFFLVTADDRETLLLPFGILLSVGVILFFLLHQSKTVEFDQDYLHITGRQSYVAVPLHRIVLIGLTNMEINKERMSTRMNGMKSSQSAFCPNEKTSGALPVTCRSIIRG
jgi:hypothetical protein